MPTSEPETFAPGTVVVVPFPYADRLAEKRRPALVVSGETVARSGFVWIAMITSARNDPMPGDLPIASSAQTGLTSPSVLRPLKIATVEASRIVRRAGTLPEDEAGRALDRVRALIGRA